MPSGKLAGGYRRARFNGQVAPGSHTTTVDSHRGPNWFGDRHHLPSGESSKDKFLPLASRPGAARLVLGGVDARRQLERDLHDGVHNEIVALIITLTLAEQDPDSPPALAGTFSARGARAQAILDSVRQIACGIYPPVLADCHVSLAGIAPRSTQPAETAQYFSCVEATPNVANHTGRTAHARLGLPHGHGVLTVRLEDDGRGFDPQHTPDGAGLRTIDGRIHDNGSLTTRRDDRRQ